METNFKSARYTPLKHVFLVNNSRDDDSYNVGICCFTQMHQEPLRDIISRILTRNLASYVAYKILPIRCNNTKCYTLKEHLLYIMGCVQLVRSRSHVM